MSDVQMEVVVTEAPKTENPIKKRRGRGPSSPLDVTQLNDKERKVFEAAQASQELVSLSTLATTCFENEPKANSWTRNSIRRLVKASWLERVARGVYRITAEGRTKAPA